MTESDYQSVCRKNAERFLKTAFILDDIPEGVDRVIKQEVTSLTKPSKGDPIPQSDDEGRTKIPDTSLNCEILIEMFMQKGIVCSIIQPKDKDNIISLIDNLIVAIEKVDLPILDWNLFKDDGDTIISILKHLIEDRSYPEGRVSLILIYTREPILGAMERLQDEFNRRLIPEQDRDNVLAMKGLRIVLVNRLSIVEEKLPDLIIREFSEAHRGILENGVMQAISEIREKTFHLLSRFPKKLDAPFLAHRAVLKNPDDSGEHAFEMITSEITSLLVQSNLPEKVFHSLAIPFAVDTIPDSKLKEIRNDGDNTQTRSIRKELKILLKEGASKKAKLLKLNDNTRLPLGFDKRKILISKITETLAADDASMLDEELSELFAFQNNYPGFVPKLTLGCIVEKRNHDASSTYLLCMLPFCDSERIKMNISIPFLTLEQVQTSTEDFNLTIPNVARLRIQYNPRNIRSYIFAPSKIQERVMPFDTIVFRTTGRVKLKWIATLKQDYAQRIANEFGAYVSRVGLNESEWQRLHSRKKS